MNNLHHYDDEEEQYYEEYRNSLRHQLDVYLEEIDPWLIPIHRAFILAIVLNLLLV